MAECVATSDTTGALRGICPDCDRMIYRQRGMQPADLEPVQLVGLLGAEGGLHDAVENVP